MQHPDEPTQTLPSFEAAGDTPELDTTVEGGSTVGPDGPDAKPSGPRPLVWLLSALLVVALIAGVVWFAVSTSRANREAAIRDTATSYLTSVADGDAALALEHLAEQPANTALLTDAVLAASKEAAPLTDVQVGAIGGEENAPTVDVSYRLGDQPVETRLQLTGDGRSSWKLVDGLGELTLANLDALTVNGAELTEATNPVFPGTYTAAPVNDKVQLHGEPTATIASPTQDPFRMDVVPGLSELGHQTVLNAVRTRYDECLAATESRPANCPFGVSTDGVEVAEGSVRFAGANDPWAAFAPVLDPAAMTAGGKIPFTVNATATVTRDGLTTEATTVLNGERGYTVDLTQDPAVVTWW